MITLQQIVTMGLQQELSRSIAVRRMNNPMPASFSKRDFKGALLQYLVAARENADADDVAQLRMNAEYIGSLSE